jgi:hypothetical protein
MRRAWVAVPAALVFAQLFGAAPAEAQVGAAIRQYSSQITIEKSGDLRIVEQIVYDFGSNSKHGITREIPTRSHYKNTRYDRLEPVSDVAVSGSPGTPTKTKVSTEAGFTDIRVGDSHRTITGVHTYTIAYRVRGVLNSFPDHDELYWNAVGDQWFVSIDSAVATVSAPAPIQRVACFEGPTGSSLSCCDPASSARLSTPRPTRWT